jgi:tetratricopeptide (TPR) repeat protein/PAS domain-containing protein
LIIFVFCTSLLAQETVKIAQETEKNQALCFENNSDMQQQIAHCVALLNSIDKANDKIEIRLKLMELYTHRGDFVAAKIAENAIDSESQFEITNSLKLKILRRKGILNYRQGELQKSRQFFNQAVNLAETSPVDEHALAKALSDLGTVFLSMMEYPLALKAYSRSLTLKETHASQKSIAVTLNNIGNVYRKMEDWQQAEIYYKKALDIYSKLGNLSSSAHTNENLGLIFVKRKQFEAARSVFLDSLNYFKQTDNAPSSMRLMILLGNLALQQNDLTQSQAYLQNAEQIELQLGNTGQSTLLKLNMGNLLSQQGHYQLADAMLLAGLNFSQQRGDKKNTLLLLKSLLKNAEKFEQWKKAFDYQTQYSALRQKNFQANFNQSLAQIRGEFEYKQQEKAIDLLNKDNRIQHLEIENQRNQSMILWLSLFLLAVIAGTFIFKQHKKRQQLKDSLQQEIDWHRRQVAQLGISNESLKAAFGQVKQALFVFNNQQHILFASDSAIHLLGVAANTLEQANLADLIDKDEECNSDFWRQIQSDERLSNQVFCDIVFLLKGSPSVFTISVTNIEKEEPLTIIVISDSEGDLQSPKINLPLSTEDFHQKLVDLMFTSVECWEISTNSTRLELAEQSGIWRVSIDDGRLRTRSLDRYLSLKSLPKKPRWREVLRTAHFVLAECQLDESAKQILTDKLTFITQHIRVQALI